MLTLTGLAELGRAQAIYGTLFLAMGLLGAMILRRRPARAHRVVLTAIVCAFIVPVAGVVVAHYELGILPAHGEQMSQESHVEPIPIAGDISAPPADIGMSLETAELTAINGSSRGSKPAGVHPCINWCTVSLWLWAGASAIVILRLFAGFLCGIALVQQAVVVDSGPAFAALKAATASTGIAASIELRSSSRVNSPVIWCWARRVILLIQQQSDDDSQVAWTGVMRHELAHLARRDHLSGLLGELLVCLFPWQILGWVAKRQMQTLSELACDDWVVSGGDGIDYAESLLALSPENRPAFVPAVLRHRSELADRVRRIAGDTCGNPRAGLLWSLALILLTIGLGAGISLAQRGTDAVSRKIDMALTSPLHEAAAGGHVQRANELLAAGARVDACDPKGMTPLGYAAANAHIETIQALLAAGANVNAQDCTHNTPLGYAARGGHRATVEALLAAGATVDTPERPDHTALGYAAEAGHAELARLLLEQGADVNAGDRRGKIAMHYAAAGGHADMVRLLAEAGTRLEISAGNGFTSLNLAASHGHSKVAEVLTDKGANINSATSSRATPLITAASKGHLDMLRLLIAGGADLDAKDYQGHNALYAAMANGHRQAAGLLIEAGVTPHFGPLHKAAYLADVDGLKRLLAQGSGTHATDIDGRTPLCYAALAGNSEAAKVLIDNGADVEATDRFERSILANTAWKGQAETVRLLIEAGVDVNRCTAEGPGKSTALYMAVMADSPDTAKVLLAAGAETEIKGYCNLMPLHRAAQRDDAGAMTKLLLDHGAEVDCKGTANMVTPLHWAAYGDRIESARLLVEHGADVNHRDKTGQTPLHKAAASAGGTCLSPGGTAKVAELLISRGARIDERTDSGVTPLHMACQRGAAAAVRLLLEKEADITAVDERGWTPMHFAANTNRAETVAILLAAGADISVRNKVGKTPLTLAADKESGGLVEAMLTAAGATR